MNDWEWVDEDGDTLVLQDVDTYEYIFWRWVPKVRVPFKANKRRYGR